MRGLGLGLDTVGLVNITGVIGYWHHHVVCLLCLSVCLWTLLHCGSQGRCTGLKVLPACSQQAHSYFVSSDTFAVVCMYRLATKRTEKDESKKTRT